MGEKHRCAPATRNAAATSQERGKDGKITPVKLVAQNGARIDAVAACLPEIRADAAERCAAVCGREKAESAAAAAGFRTLRLAKPGTDTFALCAASARRALAISGTAPGDLSAIVAVSITPGLEMPGLSHRLHGALRAPRDCICTDLRLACPGFVHGLHIASVYAAATGGKVLLCDGDVQSAAINPADAGALPVFADAAAAAIVSPSDEARDPWLFGFMSDGAEADALRLSCGGRIEMDGFGVFRFVTSAAADFIRGFMDAADARPESVDAFVPHQANMYMTGRLAKSLGFTPEKTWNGCEESGNPGSASIPVAIAKRGPDAAGKRLLAAGFGGGLSAAAAKIALPDGFKAECFDFAGEGL